MCTGGRLLADFTAGTETRPDLPAQIEEHLTITVAGLWVVWAHKLAEPAGDLFVPLTGGSGYPADARATCRVRGKHDAPEPGCTCGFHALSSRALPRLRVCRELAALTVALSGRVLAFEWAGGGVLWRAERQTVVSVDRKVPFTRTEPAPRNFRDPGDPDGHPAALRVPDPRDPAPVRLDLPVACPTVPMRHDDAGWCARPATVQYSSASLVSA
jgi:hypothetical protein